MVGQKKLYIILALLVLIGGVGVFLLYNNVFSPIPTQFRGNRYLNPVTAPDFELIDQFGRPFRLSDFKGKVIAITFIYTHCPDICPAISAGFSQLMDLLKEKGLEDDVVLVMISVDPERDTPERLREWMDLYGLEGVYLLTGDYEDVSKVWEAYGVFVDKIEVDDPNLGYGVAHTGIVYLINKNFEIEVFFLGSPPQWSADDVFNDIQMLVARPSNS